eukprot:5680129-Pleurochrysis_carterae.AAC.1
MAKVNCTARACGRAHPPACAFCSAQNRRTYRRVACQLSLCTAYVAQSETNQRTEWGWEQ